MTSVAQRKRRNPRTWLVVFIGTVIAAIAAAGGSAENAWAACEGINHCYGEAVYYPGQTVVTGGLAFLTTTVLTVPDSDHHANSEMWVCDPNNYGQCPFWVEGGQKIGFRTNPDIGGSSRAWFWAEQGGTGCGVFASHFAGFPSPDNGRHAFKISFNGNWKWAIYLDGSFVGNSQSCHADRTGKMAVGTEITHDGSVVRAQADSLQKRSADNVHWSYDWPGSTRIQDSPAWATWLNPDAALTFGAN